VTISGVRLSGATAVRFGESEATRFRVNSAGSVTAVSPRGTGTVDVTVTTPEGTSATGSADRFSYEPTVSDVQPGNGSLAGGTAVTITGTNFTGATAVRFGSSDAASFTVNSRTSITAVSPPGTRGAELTDVTVTAPGGTSAITSADRFVYAPTVTSVGPNTGPPTGQTIVTITGTNFPESANADTVVKFGSTTAISSGVVSENLIQAVAPPGTGTVDVTVSIRGASPTSPADRFTYRTPPTGSREVMAWGENESAQLGDGTSTGPNFCELEGGPAYCSPTPVATSGLSGVAAISAGGDNGMALLHEGKVMSWGLNKVGQLGDDGRFGPQSCPTPRFIAEPCSTTPEEVRDLRGVKAISAGGDHDLALLRNGAVMAWGDNSSGQLGDGTIPGPSPCRVACSMTPVPVSDLSGITAISAGGGYSLALLRNGTVMAWGANSSGQLGDGTTTSSEVPVPVSDLSGVTAISAGRRHGLALLRDGTVMAWGDNEDGQLGDGTATNSDVPVPVSGLSGVTAISAGWSHSLARLRDGTVMAWGANSFGQLGDGAFTGPDPCPEGVHRLVCRTTPGPVPGLREVKDIAAGGAHSLALLDDGSVMAWGENTYGQLGDGIEGCREGEQTCFAPVHPNSPTPVPVSGLSGVVAIAAGESHSLAYVPAEPPDGQ
jgi:alpha-tubulin suppressor-like RCC1 family protein